MAIFGMSIENTDTLKLFVKEMQNKLSKPDLFQNPFTGFIKLNYGENPYLLIHLDLLWINPFYPALFLSIALLFAYRFNITWVHLFLIPLWMGSFMFTTLFSKWAMYISLRKFGYKGKIKFIKERDLLLRLSNWGKEI